MCDECWAKKVRAETVSLPGDDPSDWERQKVIGPKMSERTRVETWKLQAEFGDCPCAACYAERLKETTEYEFRDTTDPRGDT